MLRGLLGGGHNASTHSLDSLDEVQALEDAMHATSYMMNDDMDRAEEELSKGSSAFHKTGLAVASFMRATLGFERDVMREASERLSEAEAVASEQQRRAQKHPHVSHASAYSRGTEYTLLIAEIQLMGAVIGVLTESLSESVKGFYKLRKAYISLEAIIAEEKSFFDSMGVSSVGHGRPSTTSNVNSSDHTSAEDTPGTESDSDEFFDADESQGSSEKPATYLGHVSDDVDVTKQMEDLDLNGSAQKPRGLQRLSSGFPEGADSEVFGDNRVDLFIHSGSNMCFGLLLVLLSLLPPAFSTLGKIAGFKGDRKRGLSFLWQATKFHNTNGAFAGLMLLGYYNSMLGFCDILPTTGTGSYPRERCRTLLQGFRKRYPKSRLWLLEEVRMMSTDRRPDDALVMVMSIEESPLKQVQALQWFERSMDNMYLHNYEACSESFLKMITLNKWSHGLYYYIAGSALVERYRELKVSNPEQAPAMAEKAKELLGKVLSHVGKRTIMAKRLPFDVFVSRKINKWEARAKEHGIDLVDAVGVSPIEEMIYFWNGYRKMRPRHLEASLKKLDWSISNAKGRWEDEPLDERSIAAVLRAVVLRNLQKSQEAKKVIQEELLGLEWDVFKGGLKDNWPLPIAHYEMGVYYWETYREFARKEDLEEALKFLEKVCSWESFDLDARIGLRVRVGRDTARRELETLNGSNE